MAAKKKKKDQLHTLDIETGQHQSEAGGDGGCLVSHVDPYTKDHHCSHRWQAFRKAEEYGHWYDFPAYRSLVDSDTLAPSYRPTDGSWDLHAQSTIWRHDKDTGQPAEMTVDNFQERADTPYSHNSHHLIPNSVLNNCLLDAAEVDMRLFWLVRAGLMGANYNLNDKENMIILPMRKKVAAALGLPRHISGIDTEPGESPERANHTKYNAKVRSEVEDVIAEYAEAIALEEHDADLPEFTKQRLVGISQGLFMRLRTWGKIAKGRAVNAMPD
jgi:hypothetical protein